MIFPRRAAADSLELIRGGQAIELAGEVVDRLNRLAADFGEFCGGELYEKFLYKQVQSEEGQKRLWFMSRSAANIIDNRYRR